jgi:hypothetical protein
MCIKIFQVIPVGGGGGGLVLVRTQSFFITFFHKKKKKKHVGKKIKTPQRCRMYTQLLRSIRIKFLVQLVLHITSNLI